MKINSFLKQPNSQNVEKTKKEVVDTENELTKKGIKTTKENKKIYDVLKDNNIEVSKENIDKVKNIFKELEGDFTTKLNSLNTLLKKDIDLTSKNLKAIHKTLNMNLDYSKIISTLEKFFEKNEINYEKLLKTNNFSDEFVKSFLEEFDYKLNSKDNSEDNSKKNLKNNLKNNLKKFINNEKDLKENDKKIAKDLIEDIKKPEDNLEGLNKQVKEVLDNLKQDIGLPNDFLVNDNFKKFLVQKTNKKMTQVKKEFDTFQNKNKELIKNMINNKPSSNDLQKVIKNFDKIIMKSNITLYTSMKQEKDLIQMSSKLKEAKDLLESNNINKSKQILKNILKKLEKIDFKPKDVKIKAFMESKAKEILFNKNDLNEVKSKLYNKEPKGVRDQVEILRKTGLNHESEVIQNLEKDENQNIDLKNLKSMLLKLSNNETSFESKESLSNLRGNQLLNKVEVNANMQNNFLNIPYVANGKIKNIDLFINSKKESESLDWKNTTLYFEMDLKSYGKTGIKISVTDKYMNMKVLNDNKSFKKDTKEVFNEFLNNLSDIGYEKGKVVFVRFNEKETNKDKIKLVDKSLDNNKGFDIKI
ncbi:MAG: hypothetical protein ACQEQE_02670 [Bacillota bacterium]